MCASDAKAFLSWAEDDAMIVGIAPWHWLGCPGCVHIGDDIGTANLTASKAVWNSIGSGIVAAYPTPWKL